MDITKLPLVDIPQFSNRDKAYISEDPELSPFFVYPVELSSFEKIIQNKQSQNIDRSLLVSVLKDQYASIDTAEKVQKNIEALGLKNTFTIITAHQPSLMTGPAYYIYKILSALNLSKLLKKNYKAFDFVPVFITGGEDHDFEEMNHLNIYGKELTWSSGQVGSVGKFELDGGFRQVLDELKNILGESENATLFIERIESFAQKSKTYAQFAIHLTNELFKKEGLVVLDMSDRRFKESFSPIMKREILDQVSEKLIQETQSELDGLGYKAQAMARPINFFYTGTGDRLRIEPSDSGFELVGSDKKFTKAEMLNEIENQPQLFSPNVVMRPVFQEFIMPNLAYIGGGGEIAYWLERKTQFQTFDIPFPMLIRRNSAVFIDKGSRKKMDKFGFDFNQLTQTRDSLITQYLESKDGENLSFEEEVKSIAQIFEKIADKAHHIDATLKPKILAEGTRVAKQVENLTGRVKRSAKQNEEIAINQIDKILEKLFPGNGLQERKASFIEIYVKYGDDLWGDLIQHFNPLEKEMIIIWE